MAVPGFGSSRSALMGGCPGVQGLGFRFRDALLIRYFYVAVGAMPVTSVLALFWLALFWLALFWLALFWLALFWLALFWLALFAWPAKHNQLACYFRAS